MRLFLHARNLLVFAAALVLVACSPEAQLYSAARSGDAKAIKRIIADRKIKDINKPAGNSQTALHLAAERNRLEVMRLLIAAGANVNLATDNQETPLHVAAYYGYLEAAQLLIAAGAELDPRHKINALTPLLNATSKNHTDVAKLLILSGADPFLETGDGRDAMTTARRIGNHEFVAWLEAYGKKQ